MGRLKEKIQKYMTDRNKSNKVGIKLLNHLGETQRPRPRSDTNNHSNDSHVSCNTTLLNLYKLIQSTY
jgi:hypothetical protein